MGKCPQVSVLQSVISGLFEAKNSLTAEKQVLAAQVHQLTTDLQDRCAAVELLKVGRGWLLMVLG
jgi:hypothetical protein